MKRMTIILCLLALVALGQIVETPKFDPIINQFTVRRPKEVAVLWYFVDEYRTWLTVRATNGVGWMKQGYHFSYTDVICRYKPKVHQIGKDTWEIQFVSPIAENLP